MRADKEIIHYAQQDGLMLSMASLNKVMDTILKLEGFNLYEQDLDDDVDTMEVIEYDKTVKPENRMRISAKARELIHILCEQFLAMEFTMAQFQTVHAKRKTLFVADLKSVQKVSEIHAPEH